MGYAKTDIIEQLRELGSHLCCVDRNLIDSARFEIERLRQLVGQIPQRQDIALDDDLGLYIKTERLRRHLFAQKKIAQKLTPGTPDPRD